jgi:hypothetical protein
MMRNALLLLVLAAGAVGCGASTNGPSTTSPLHGEVGDPAGDAVSDPRVPVAPDLVRATADVASGRLVFAIQFAAGTLDRATTRVSILLDTDESASTGIAESGNFGADYGLDLNASTGTASVTRANPANCAAHLTCFDSVGSVPITVVTDGLQITVPLDTFVGADGRLTFRMHSYVLVTTLTAVTFDYMPDVNLAAARVQ